MGPTKRKLTIWWNGSSDKGDAQAPMHLDFGQQLNQIESGPKGLYANLKRVSKPQPL
jgi:hypothetical protein